MRGTNLIDSSRAGEPFNKTQAKTHISVDIIRRLQIRENKSNGISSWKEIVIESGEQLRQMTNRFTYSLKKVNESWVIAHEHSSLPINIETGKGIFNLK